jgi:hypothetical protein
MNPCPYDHAEMKGYGHEKCPYCKMALTPVAGSAEWTVEKPTAAGWYWVRSLPKYDERIIRFKESTGERAGQIEPITGELSAHGWKEFSGPILPPNSQADPR